jgi:hydrogenase maturation protease
MQNNQQSHILVLGLGNLLLQDEGLGVRALERLMDQYRLPDQVRTLDGGTLGITLLPFLEEVSHLLVLDAVHTGNPPGTLVRIEGEALQKALSLKVSVHQTGLQELLALGLLQGSLPPHIVVCGMQPSSIAWGVDLSSPVAGQIDLLVQMAIETLYSWGGL